MSHLSLKGLGFLSILAIFVIVSCTTAPSGGGGGGGGGGGSINDAPMVLPSTNTDVYTTPSNYHLVWSDEFNGTQINTSDWGYDTVANGWSHTFNYEWQDYIDNGTGGSNAFVTNGVLVIKAIRKQPYNAIHSYDSARLLTKGKHSWQYGKIAARMTQPYGNGIWPAFWMMGDGGGTWPACGEIDIMELIGGSKGAAKGGGDNESFATCHWANAGNAYASYGTHTTISGDPKEMHVYELEWSTNSIKMYLNGVNYYTLNTSPADMSEFRQTFYILFNLAVGGEWPGYPDSSTVFPQYMYIDWVRVYQHD